MDSLIQSINKKLVVILKQILIHKLYISIPQNLFFKEVLLMYEIIKYIEHKKASPILNTSLHLLYYDKLFLRILQDIIT